MYGLVVIRSSAHASIGAERQKQGGGGKKRRQASETLRHLSPHNFGGGDGGGGGYVYYLWAVVVWYPLGFVENVPSMNWRSVARLKALICPISNLQTFFAEDSLLLGLGGRGVGWGGGEFAWFFLSPFLLLQVAKCFTAAAHRRSCGEKFTARHLCAGARFRIFFWIFHQHASKIFTFLITTR